MKFTVDDKPLKEVLGQPQYDPSWIRVEVKRKLGYQSFQRPEKISDAIKLISDIFLWNELANELSEPADTIQMKLDLIVDRRNKIAHEADVNPAFPLERWPIDQKMASDSVDYTEVIVKSIHKVVLSTTV